MAEEPQQEPPDQPSEPSTTSSEPEPEPEEPEKPPETFPCPECGEVFTTSGTRNFHHYNVHVKPNMPKDQTCPICGAGPFTKADLKSHTKKKHKGDKMPERPDPSPEPEEIADSPESEDDDDTPLFKGPRADAMRRRQRLEQALSVFELKDKVHKTILRVWDTYENVRTDDRDFYDFIARLDGVELDTARRIVDLVFGGRDAAGAIPPPYYPRHPGASPASNPPYFPPYESRGYGDSRGWYPNQPPYYPPQAPPQYPPMMQPRDDPNVMSRQEHELRLELEKRKSEIDQKEREMEDLKARMERLESGPLPNQLPPNELEKDKQIDRLERKMEEMQRQRDSELRDQRMDGRLKMIEHQLNETRGGREETIDLLKRQGLIGQPQGMSDTAQVQMKELDTKLGVFTKSVDDLKDIAKTWMTMGQPMRRSGAPLTEEERELARRELGG